MLIYLLIAVAALLVEAMTGERNFFFKAFALFTNCDKMIGGDFEKGLANLKTVSETARPSPSTAT